VTANSGSIVLPGRELAPVNYPCTRKKEGTTIMLVSFENNLCYKAGQLDLLWRLFTGTGRPYCFTIQTGFIKSDSIALKYMSAINRCHKTRFVGKT